MASKVDQILGKVAISSDSNCYNGEPIEKKIDLSVIHPQENGRTILGLPASSPLDENDTKTEFLKIESVDVKYDPEAEVLIDDLLRLLASHGHHTSSSLGTVSGDGDMRAKAMLDVVRANIGNAPLSVEFIHDFIRGVKDMLVGMKTLRFVGEPDTTPSRGPVVGVGLQDCNLLNHDPAEVDDLIISELRSFCFKPGFVTREFELMVRAYLEKVRWIIGRMIPERITIAADMCSVEVTKLLGEDILKLSKTDARRQLFEIAFILLFRASHRRFVSTLELCMAEFSEKYPDFGYAKLNADECNKLLKFRNVMAVVQKLIPPNGNKQHLLDIVARIAEGHADRYITGGGMTVATKRRVHIYEKEGGITAQPRVRTVKPLLPDSVPMHLPLALQLSVAPTQLPTANQPLYLDPSAAISSPLPLGVGVGGGQAVGTWDDMKGTKRKRAPKPTDRPSPRNEVISTLPWGMNICMDSILPHASHHTSQFESFPSVGEAQRDPMYPMWASSNPAAPGSRGSSGSLLDLVQAMEIDLSCDQTARPLPLLPLEPAMFLAPPSTAIQATASRLLPIVSMGDDGGGGDQGVVTMNGVSPNALVALSEICDLKGITTSTTSSSFGTESVSTSASYVPSIMESSPCNGGPGIPSC